MDRAAEPQPARAAVRLALCVDDFGLHEGVNRAVLDLARLDRINAVSCMVGGPAWPAGARELATLDRDRIDLGLHLDLTELPLIPSSRRKLSRLIVDAYTRRLDTVALGAEIQAQLDAFERHTGRAPDYVDGHQHVHQLPVVRDVLLDVLGQRYTARLPWLRSTRHSASGLRGRFKPWLIESLGSNALVRMARARGHGLNRHLLGVHDFRADAGRYQQLLARWLDIAVDGDLLMCHPAVPLSASDPLLASRSAEYEVLCDERFDAALERTRIELMPISRTLAARPG